MRKAEKLGFETPLNSAFQKIFLANRQNDYAIIFCVDEIRHDIALKNEVSHIFAVKINGFAELVRHKIKPIKLI